ALRATAESADRAALLGIPVRRLQSVLWAIVGVLAYVTLFLRNGVIGASVSQALDPSVLLAALGAAVIGRMERLPTTVFASVGLGIVSEAVFYRWDNDAARPVVITGWAGQVSLGQMAVAGVTGAAAGWFCTNFTDPVIGGTVVAMLIGGIVGAIVTAAIGMPTLRVRGLTFAVMSLAFALVTSK